MTLRKKGLDTAEALLTFIHDSMLDMRVALPGQIVKVNYSSNGSLISVDVQPQIRQTVTQEDTLDLDYNPLPIISRVPVVWPHSNKSGFALTIDVQEGDQVLLVFADRSIDMWQDTGQLSSPVEPAAPRTHDISDAIAIIGLSFDVDDIPNYAFPGICLRNRANTVSVCVSDEVQIKSNGSTITVSDNEIDNTATTISLNGTTIDLDGTTVTMQSGANSVVVSAAGIALNGPVTITGAMTINGVDFGQFFSDYNNHHHIAPNGGGPTGGPLQ